MPYIKTDIQQHCATITLQRTQQQNALNRALIDELNQSLACIKAHSQVRCLVIDSEGPHFCSGADLRWLQAACQLSDDDNYHDANQLAQLLQTIATLPLLTIAYVSGNCLGGGLGLAACCDMVLADTQAKFGCPELQIGMVPAIIMPYLVDKIGLQHAKEWVYSGNRYTAKQAQQAQLIDLTVDVQQASRVIQNWQDQTLKNNIDAFKITKLLFAECSVRHNMQSDVVTIMAKQRLGKPVQKWIEMFLDK